MPDNEKRSCFVIAPIGGKDTEIRKRSDKVLKHIFRKALDDKFKVTRGDEIDEPGMITTQVLRAVQESDLVVADLTTHNPNVLYELAVRHAVEKPVIHVIEPRLSKIPFDIAGFRTVEFDLTDPDSIEGAVEQVKRQADQAMSGKWGETPIKLANIMRRTTDDTPQLLLLKQAVEGISNISARLSSLEMPVMWAGGGTRPINVLQTTHPNLITNWVVEPDFVVQSPQGSYIIEAKTPTEKKPESDPKKK
ncbi:MAG TPA: hypothetical protein VK763_20615 [Terriglobales bacterium]|jgi:hypothetical protein|nr:hypothetical protein [Terriglobales bacterium]